MVLHKNQVQLLLSSRLSKLQRDGQRNKAHDFTFKFEPPFILDPNMPYKAAVKRINMSYSWHNIAESYRNNTLKWRKSRSSGWNTIRIPDSMYTYDYLNAVIQGSIGKVDQTQEKSPYAFDIYMDYALFRVIINLADGYELDLSDGEFSDIIGFDKKVYSGATSYSGARVPNLTRGVDPVFIHSDIVTRSVNDISSTVIFDFPTSHLVVSYPFKREPLHLEWHDVNRSYFDRIRVWVTDERGYSLFLNDIDIVVNIIIEQDAV